MLRLYSKITFTPKEEQLANTNITGAELVNLLSKPLVATNRSEIVFDFVTDVEIDSSFKNQTSTAKITIPRKLSFEGKPIANGINSIFKRMDRVKIETGYFPDLRVSFEGFVSQVKVGTPLVIECEDSMILLKQKKIVWPLRYGTITKGKRGKTLKNAKIIPTKIKLADLLTVLLEGTGIKYKCLTDVEINVKRLDSSVAEVLNELKKEYGIYSYFVDGVLHSGLAADASQTETVEFVFEEDIIDESDLVYQRIDDVLLQIEAESINSKTNERKSVTVGDDDGQHRKFFIMNATEAELRKFALSKLYEEKFEGMRGSFEAFGEPFVKSGDAVKLTSKKYPEKNGTYTVVGVTRKFGQNGYRQKIEIGQRLNF